MPPALAAALVGLASAAVLVLEVLVTRLVAPYVGLTLETYTAAIGVALGAIAAGAALGGRLADRVDPRRWLGPALALGGALVLGARPTVFLLGGDARGAGPTATVLLVLVAVAPAALVLSAVPPGVVKLQLRTLAETGQTVGRLSAAGTLGGLAGTFLTGFVLLVSFPTSTLLLLTGLLLLAAGVALALALPAVVPRVPIAAALGVALLTGAALTGVQGPCEEETRYYCARVVADPERASGRVLVLDGLSHSYVDLADPAHLEFAYTRRIGAVLAAQPAGPLDVLHVGGGGFSVPRHLAAVRPGSRSTVLELDPELVALGRERLGLQTSDALRVQVGDGRTLIAEQPDAAYDVVVGDAFGSLAVPWHLTTVEFLAQVRRVLRPGGVYVLNLIDHGPLHFARAEAATLARALGDVAALSASASLAEDDGGNLVLVAGDRLDVAALRAAAAPLGGSVAGPQEVAAFAEGAPVLTDDDAPVDQLLTPYRPPAQAAATASRASALTSYRAPSASTGLHWVSTVSSGGRSGPRSSTV